jgi:hypothetical protein
MAKITVEEADLDPAQKEAVLKGKFSQISDMHDLATARHLCFRRGITRYFQEEKPTPRKSLALQIVQWLFSTREKSRRWRHCCDRCESVTTGNYAMWVRKVFGG